MNAAHNNSFQDDPELDYQAVMRRPETPAERRGRRPEHIRTSRPAGFNGKHRRRNKRYGF